MRPAVIGLVAGLGASIAIAKALQSLLFGITAADPITLAGVVFVLLIPSGFACYIPARRASTVDPVIALRHE